MLKLNYSKFKLECGTDEAGRGCLAGPITAAAILIPKDLIALAIKYIGVDERMVVMS